MENWRSHVYYDMYEDDQSLLIKTSSCTPSSFRTNYYSSEILHGVTAIILTYVWELLVLRLKVKIELTCLWPFDIGIHMNYWVICF